MPYPMEEAENFVNDQAMMETYALLLSRKDAEIARLKKSIEGMKLGLEDISKIEDEPGGINFIRLIARQALAAARSEAKGDK